MSQLPPSKVHFLSQAVALIQEFSSSPQSEEYSHLVFIQHIISKQVEVIKYLNLSVLSGEYYNNADCKELLGNAKESIAILYSWVGEIPSKEQDELPKVQIEQLYEELTLLKRSIQNYDEFREYLDQSLKDTGNVFLKLNFESELAEFDKDWGRHIEDFSEIKNKLGYWLLLLNLYLAEFDEFYICNEENLKVLVNISEKIEQLYSDEILTNDNKIPEIIGFKSDYLIFKILYRLRKRDGVGIDFYVLRKGDKHTINIDSIHSNLNNPYVNNFRDQIDSHYYISHKLTSIKSYGQIIDILKILSQETVDINISQLHLLCKYVNNNDKEIVYGNIEEFNLITLKGFLYKLNEKYQGDRVKNGDDRFCLYAIDSALYFINNTIFKLKAIEVIAKCKEIKSVQEYTEKINSFCTLYKTSHSELISNINDHSTIQLYKQFVPTATEYISLLRQELRNFPVEDINDNYKAIIESLKLLTEEVNAGYYDALRRIKNASRKKLMPLYLLYDECIIKDQLVSLSEQVSEPVTLFVDGAYVLPPDFDFLKERFLDNLTAYNEEYIKFRETISNDIIVLNQQEIYQKKLDDKIKDNQINHIQIIGFYVGFIIFTLGSVSIIPKFEMSYFNILLFLFVFSSSLLLFAFALRFMFQFKEVAVPLNLLVGLSLEKKSEAINCNNWKYWICWIGRLRFEYRFLPIFFFFSVFTISIILIQCNRNTDTKAKTIITTKIKEYIQVYPDTTITRIDTERVSIDSTSMLTKKISTDSSSNLPKNSRLK